MKTVTQFFRENSSVGFVDNVMINAETETRAVIRQHDDGEYLDDQGNVIIEECTLSTCNIERELLLAACG